MLKKMKTITLNYSDAHKFVEQNSHRGYYWSGWDIVRWLPNHSGFTAKNGKYRNGTWGMSFTYPLSDDGTWQVKVPANVEYN